MLSGPENVDLRASILSVLWTMTETTCTTSGGAICQDNNGTRKLAALSRCCMKWGRNVLGVARDDHDSRIVFNSVHGRDLKSTIFLDHATCIVPLRYIAVRDPNHKICHTTTRYSLDTLQPRYGQQPLSLNVLTLPRTKDSSSCAINWASRGFSI